MRVSDILGLSLVVVACTIAIAACGSSSEKPAATSHADTGSRIQRVHARARRYATSPTRLAAVAAINIAGTGIKPASPSFRSARASCSKLLPGGGPGTHASEQEIKQDTETAECMREHGVTAFPDPIVTATPPAINPSAIQLGRVRQRDLHRDPQVHQREFAGLPGSSEGLQP